MLFFFLCDVFGLIYDQGVFQDVLQYQSQKVVWILSHCLLRVISTYIPEYFLGLLGASLKRSLTPYMLP